MAAYAEPYPSQSLRPDMGQDETFPPNSYSAGYFQQAPPADFHQPQPYQPGAWPIEQKRNSFQHPQAQQYPQNQQFPSSYPPSSLHPRHSSQGGHALVPRRYSNTSASSASVHDPYYPPANSTAELHPSYAAQVSRGSSRRSSMRDGARRRSSDRSDFVDEQEREERRRRRRKQREQEEKAAVDESRPSMGDTVVMVWRTISHMLSPKRAI